MLDLIIVIKRKLNDPAIGFDDTAKHLQSHKPFKISK